MGVDEPRADEGMEGASVMGRAVPPSSADGLSREEIGALLKVTAKNWIWSPSAEVRSARAKLLARLEAER